MDVHDDDAIPAEEELLLARVEQALQGAAPRSVRMARGHANDELLALRDEIGEARLEDVPALVAQMERLQEVSLTRAELETMLVDARSPYFGHLRLREQRPNGAPIERDVLIGRATFTDAKARVAIVDWRNAPVSQLCYCYSEGSDYDETFGDREVEGEILARRTLTIENGELLRVACPQGIWVKHTSADGTKRWHRTDLRLAGDTAVFPAHAPVHDACSNTHMGRSCSCRLQGRSLAMRHVALSVPLLAVLIPTCSSSSKCQPGTEKCQCGQGNTCNAGLSCRSDLCVNADTDGSTGGHIDADSSPGSGGAHGRDAPSDPSAVADVTDDAPGDGSVVGAGGNGGTADAGGGERMFDAASSPDYGTEPLDHAMESGNYPDAGVTQLDVPAVSRCGDGIPSQLEQCDDGNTGSGDGCSERCLLEVGWKCGGSPSRCTHTVCGDGKIEGAEACEDGNAMPFDGCSASCHKEPACPLGTACKTVCGDGIVADEECDDGNNLDGDGCSAACQVEIGWACTPSTPGSKLLLPAIHRDFKFHNPPSFEPGTGPSTTPVTARLESDGELTAAADGGDQWFRNVSGVNHATTGALTLWSDGQGAFVNRHGASGEQWDTGAGLLDGTPLYFPVDDDTFSYSEATGATIPPPYAPDGTYLEDKDSAGNRRLHNFSFTSEFRFWFKYDPSTTYVLDILGDDDIWAYINWRPAIDLGGMHYPEEGSITLSSANAATFGLAADKIYQVAIFRAERQSTMSTLKVSIRGLFSSPSVCSHP